MAGNARESVNHKFGGKVRVRVGGILIENDQILLLKHEGVGKKEFLWSPPGGGMEFGENAEENLKTLSKHFDNSVYDDDIPF